MPHVQPGEELREVLFILGANLLALPLVIAVAWLTVERMIRPIRDITDTAARISAGQISTPSNHRNPLHAAPQPNRRGGNFTANYG